MHIWFSSNVPVSAKLHSYWGIALCRLDMKVLTGWLTNRILEVLTRYGVVMDWQPGALPAYNTLSPLFWWLSGSCNLVDPTTSSPTTLTSSSTASHTEHSI